MTRAICLIMVAGLCVAACGPRHDFAYNGSWIGHRKLTPKPGTDAQVVNEASRLTLTLRDDGTFTMIDAGIKKGGDYHIEGDHAVLNVETILDQPMDRQEPDVQARNVPITLTPTGKNLKFFDSAGFDPGGLMLERTDTPTPQK
ncbi:MAG: hypothetical protein ACYC96_02485 [Fimbriimonadaceae bacterium]